MQKVKIPASQVLWMTMYDGKGNPLWLITSDAARTKYYLYKMEGEKPEKVKTGKSPQEFEKEIGMI